jgi:hypothetical protein
MNTETITFVLAELERAERRIAVIHCGIKDAVKNMEELQAAACEAQAKLSGLRITLTVEKNAAKKGK